jgi:acyl-CoA synthetase (AMP-forming)/AMP-acid ligase II
MAGRMGDAIAVAVPGAGHSFKSITFAQLEAEVTRLAEGLAAWGVPRGARLVLLVRPGIEFVALVFALLRAGMVIVLVDPGLGRRNLVRCLGAVEPEGFVAVPIAQATRLLLRSKFPRAVWNVTAGRRWFWGGITLDQLRTMGATRSPGARSIPAPCSLHSATYPADPAAIIFTSGSTGPPKGVLYTHRMFDTQVAEIQANYRIQPGGVDLACFPLFALFNAAMGVSTVFPDMDFSRPGSVDPRRLLDAANRWRVNQAFASPAVWRVVAEHCAQTGEQIESLQQVFSCGAPVGSEVLRKTLRVVAPAATMHTPYGATECLPVATIEAAEVLEETANKTDQGGGVCVGRKFESIDWRVIRITDLPISTIDDAETLRPGEIGELIVRGPQASPEYATSADHTAEAKIADGNTFWHRMGDVGYLDEQDRFWYCGRKSQRVETRQGTLFTECVEAVFNRHPDVARTALVGLGTGDHQLPVILFELNAESRRGEAEVATELHEIGQQFPPTRCIKLFAEFDKLPVDVRHNSKILREELVEWAKELELRDFNPLPSPA